MSLDTFMIVRAMTLALFGFSALVSMIAVLRGSLPAVPLLMWCAHTFVFTLVTILRAIGILHIGTDALNLWSATVRLHGGFTILSLAIYYYARRFS